MDVGLGAILLPAGAAFEQLCLRLVVLPSSKIVKRLQSASPETSPRLGNGSATLASFLEVVACSNESHRQFV